MRVHTHIHGEGQGRGMSQHYREHVMSVTRGKYCVLCCSSEWILVRMANEGIHGRGQSWGMPLHTVRFDKENICFVFFVVVDCMDRWKSFWMDYSPTSEAAVTACRLNGCALVGMQRMRHRVHISECAVSTLANAQCPLSKLVELALWLIRDVPAILFSRAPGSSCAILQITSL